MRAWTNIFLHAPKVRMGMFSGVQTCGVQNLLYFTDGDGLSYDDMRAKCESRNHRLCYFNELCPQGGPNKPPVGGQQATTDMWAPVVTSLTDSSPEWVQVGTRDGGMCDKHTVYGPVNEPGSWMATNEKVDYKRIYPCCCQGDLKSILFSQLLMFCLI